MIVPCCYPSENQKFKICPSIFNLHLLRLHFPWKDVAHCESCTSYRGHSVDFGIYCSCIPCSAATVPGYRILISSLAVPEETGSSTWKNLAERRQKHHNRAVMEMQRELGYIGRVRQEFFIQSGALLKSGPKIQMITLTSCYRRWQPLF